MMVGGLSSYYKGNIAMNEKNAISLVSYQAEGTPGRTLLEKKMIRVDGKLKKIKGKFEHFNFSSHSGSKQLFEMIDGIKGNPTIVAVHAEEEQATSFAKKVQKQMKDASESQQFERAIEIRDTLQRLGSIDSGKKMEDAKKSDEEYFGIRYGKQDAIVMTFRQTHGVIRDSEKFSFDLIGDNNLTNFLYQYYTTHQIPKTIVTSEEVEEKQSLADALTDRAGFLVKIVVGAKGKRKEMIELILRNLDLIQSKNAEPGLVELRDILKLPSIPRIIECFDISNHGDEYAVGSMARFVDGKPDKSGYRKFKIKTVTGRDDFAMINEIVGRRYWRLRKEKSEFPDLIVIDGGKGQLTAALSALKEVGIETPCVSLAKENEEIFIPRRTKSIRISKNKDSIKILQHIRDETHRFGVAYNRSLRKFD